MGNRLLDWWRSWWSRPLDHLHVILYTRKGCHLCDDAAAVLARAQRRYRFPLEIIDVDSDPALAERYGLQIPVVTVDGKLRFRGRVNAVLLERLLRAAAPRD